MDVLNSSKEPSFLIPRVYIEVLKIWLLFFVYDIVLIALINYFHIFHFAALSIVNRVWAALLLVLFFKYFIRVFLSFNHYLFLLIIFSFWGLFNGNPVKFVISDFFLFLVPLVFYYYARSFNLTINKINVFLMPYFKIMFFSVLLIFSGKLFFGNNFVFKRIRLDVDYLIVMSYLFVNFSFREMISYIWKILVLFYTFFSHKVFLIQLFATVIYSQRKKFFNLILIILTLFFFNYLLSLQHVELTGEKKLKSFYKHLSVGSMEVVKEFIAEPDCAFDYFDPSTAERIYEFFVVFNKNRKNPLTLLLGQGLGGYADLSLTGDTSVIKAHKGKLKTRVFHLGVTVIFCKFGMLGIVYFGIAVLFLLFKAFEKANKVYVNNDKKIIADTLLLFFILSIIGCFFTFGYFYKVPMFGITMYSFLAKES